MKKLAMLLALFVFVGLCITSAQTVQITGLVTSSEDGQPLPGASIIIKGTTVGTTTDFQGKYSLSIPTDAKTLVFSFVGMKNQEVAIAGKAVVDVVLSPDVVGLDEVVVTALGITREKKSLGYAVQAVSGAQLTQASNPNLGTSLQGKVSGVEIRQSSGMPGAPSQIFIRGARSFSGNNNPLYVVDGLPISSDADYSMGGDGVSGSNYSNRTLDIDPNDIESINILKGQAASALYGMRASNGVVLIVTKKGSGAVGKPVVSLSINRSNDQISRLPDFQKTWAQGNYGEYGAQASASWGPKIKDLPNDLVYGGNNMTAFHAAQGIDPSTTQGLFWSRQKQAWVTPVAYDNAKNFFRTGTTNNVNLNISQGGTFGNYSIGIGNTSQDGIVDNTGMKRTTAKAAADFNVNKKWKAGISTNFSQSKVDKLPSGNSSYLFTVYGAPPSFDLNGSPYYEKGNPYKQLNYRKGTFDNPKWAINNNVFNEKNQRFFGDAYSQYTPVKWLNVKYQLGLDEYSTDFEDIYEMGSAETGGATFSATYPSATAPSGGSIHNYGIIRMDVNSLFTINFDKQITEDIHLNALVGNEFNQKNNRYWDEQGYGFNVGGWHNIANTNSQTASEDKHKYRTVGFFGNVGLDWKRMIFLNVTGRNDVVSSMPENNRSFFYPSVQLGWVFTELGPLKDNKILSFGKLRGSYAEVGQAADEFYNPYFLTEVHGSGMLTDGITYPFNGVTGYTQPITIYNPDLKPQNTKSLEGGIELKFFNNRIGIDYTYAKQTTVDQIFSVPLAGSTGYTKTLTNGGKMTSVANELSVNIIPVLTKSFNWTITVNYYKNKNVCESLAPGVESIFLGGFTDPQVRASIGNTFPAIYGTAFDRDAKGNVRIDDDPTSGTYGFPLAASNDKVIGQVTPKCIMGFNNQVTYKFVSFSFLIDWKNGGQIYSGSNRLIDLYGVSKKTEDRNTPFVVSGVKASDGTPNDIVRGGKDDPYAYEDYYWNYIGGISEAHIYKTSYVKLREISLVLTLPKSISGKLKLQNISVNVFARNILLWTTLPNFDPETSQGDGNMQGGFDYMSLPQTKSFGMGLNLSF
jgi:TonB-linked SusC/RagA family outer membrane protein